MCAVSMQLLWLEGEIYQRPFCSYKEVCCGLDSTVSLHNCLLCLLCIALAQEKGNAPTEQVAGNAAYVLLLPGKVLDISTLNTVHKFRG